MRWLAHSRALLWLGLIAVVPAAMLDLAAIGPDAAGFWSPVIVLAGVFGFPYYALQSLIGITPGVEGALSPVEVVLSAVLAALPFVAAHWLLVRRFRVAGASNDAPAA
jgi:hypothetical protein